MRWKEIMEAPIADFGTYGSMDTEGSFRPNDLKAMTNPKWQAKLHRMFQNTKHPINLYLVNMPNDKTSLGLMGHPNTHSSSYRDLSGIDGWSGFKSPAEIEKMIGHPLPPNTWEAITVALVENEGDGRMALTPWMVAHRVVHAMAVTHKQDDPVGREINTLIAEMIKEWRHMVMKVHDLARGTDDYDDISQKEKANGFKIGMYQAVAELICKFKSAEHGFTNDAEMLVEMFTQYIIHGKLTFKRPDLDGRGTTTQRQLEGDEKKLFDRLTRDCPRAFHDKTKMLDFLIGKQPSKPRDKMLAMDADGVIMAEFTSAPERKADYEARGMKVITRKPSWQSVKKYTDYEAEAERLCDIWDRWEEEDRNMGFPRRTVNDRLYDDLDHFERLFNQAFNRVMIRCIGRCLVL